MDSLSNKTSKINWQIVKRNQIDYLAISEIGINSSFLKLNIKYLKTNKYCFIINKDLQLIGKLQIKSSQYFFSYMSLEQFILHRET